MSHADYQVLHGDCRTVLDTLPEQSFNSCVTSPPYWLARSYRGGEREIGQERDFNAYLISLVQSFRAVRRVLRDDGTLWVVLGDSYVGSGYSNHRGTGGRTRARGGRQKHLKVEGLSDKSLLGLPWEVARVLAHDGWLLRRDIIWRKANPMPESVKDRPWTEHEYVFLFAKQPRYQYEPVVSKCLGSVWTIGYAREDICDQRAGSLLMMSGDAGDGLQLGHPAAFPIELAATCLERGCPNDGSVLDPFCGSGTTGIAALRQGCSFTGIDLNPVYCRMAEARLAQVAPGQRTGNPAQLPLEEIKP